MKIDAVVNSKSDDRQTAFRTIPPLTEEVFACALQNYLGAEKVDIFGVFQGLFIVFRTAIGTEQIQTFEKALTDAEEFLSNQKTSTETPHKNSLQERAKKLGLPLVD